MSAPPCNSSLQSVHRVQFAGSEYKAYWTYLFCPRPSAEPIKLIKPIEQGCQSLTQGTHDYSARNGVFDTPIREHEPIPAVRSIKVFVQGIRQFDARFAVDREADIGKRSVRLWWVPGLVQDLLERHEVRPPRQE